MVLLAAEGLLAFCCSLGKEEARKEECGERGVRSIDWGCSEIGVPVLLFIVEQGQLLLGPAFGVKY